MHGLGVVQFYCHALHPDINESGNVQLLTEPQSGLRYNNNCSALHPQLEQQSNSCSYQLGRLALILTVASGGQRG